MSELVAITDLHLGDRDPANGSLLTSLDVRKTFADVLGRLVGGHIETLVITGDLFEVCVPSRTVEQDLLHETTCFGLYDSTVEDAKAFFVELARTTVIDRLVWVPGNHDFALYQRICANAWVDKLCQLRASGAWCFGPELARLFGSAIRNIDLSYPNYVRAGEEDWPMVLFTHGHLYDNQVLRPDTGFLSAIGIALETGHLWNPIPEELDTSGGSWTKKLVELTNHRVSDVWPQNLSLVKEAVYDYVLRRQTRVLCRQRPQEPGQMCLEPVFGSIDPSDDLRGHLGWYLDNVLVDIAPFVERKSGAVLPVSYFVCGHTHQGGDWIHESLDGLIFEIHDLGGWTMDAAKNRDNVPHTHALVWERFPGKPNCYALNVGKP